MSDLISKSALALHIEKGYRKYGEDFDAEQILCDLEDFPTIDAEPVRHGRWLISEYEYFDCSICGEYYPNGCDSHEEAERKLKNHDAYAYCPHCGAKMENGGGEKE